MTSVKGVASPSNPRREETFERRHSIKCAIVIREGIA